MKIALIGQEIPNLLPTMLTDLLFVSHQAATIAVEEKNAAMQDVLQKYGDAIFAHAGIGGQFVVTQDRLAVLQGADCVIYAGDVMASSRFQMDRDALSGNEEDEEDDPFSLVDQARVNGGIGGLMHTLRQGKAILTLCEQMREACPNALVIDMGQPIARTVALFEQQGFTTYGLGPSTLKGPSGLEGIAQKLGLKMENLHCEAAGLPGFSFLMALSEKELNSDLIDRADELVRAGEFGRLPQRWLRRYGVISIGDAPAHAEWMPAQDDYIPESKPQFGESVEKRKERILHMNTVGSKGAKDADGAMAQLLLLRSTATSLRPMRLAITMLRGEDVEMPGVARLNRGEIQGLPAAAVIESTLVVQGGEMQPHCYQLPGEMLELCMDIDETNRLAARATTGDRTALRECIEMDPALVGLDRLYIEDVVDRMIEMHSDVIYRFSDEEEED